MIVASEDSIQVKTNMVIPDPQSSDNLLELYGAALHGGMAAGYLTTLPYHVKRRRWAFVAVGLVGIVYHLWSVHNHVRPTCA